MKTPTLVRTIALGAALPLAILGGNLPSQAQPKAKVAQGKKPPKKGGAVKHAEDILGKPLSEAQKTAVRAAQKQRQQAMKPIQEKLKATVAKALGLSVAQYEAREKVLHSKTHH